MVSISPDNGFGSQGNSSEIRLILDIGVGIIKREFPVETETALITGFEKTTFLLIRRVIKVLIILYIIDSGVAVDAEPLTELH